MAAHQVWVKSLLRRLWVYQSFCVMCLILLGFSRALFIDVASVSWFRRWLVRYIIYSTSLHKLCLYIFIIGLEAVLLGYATLPPALMVVMTVCRLVIASDSLSESVRTVMSHQQPAYGYEKDWPPAGRIFTNSTQHLILGAAFWLATYEGVAYAVVVWALHRAQQEGSTDDSKARRYVATVSQFSFTDCQWSMPIRIAQWIRGESNSTPNPPSRSFASFAVGSLKFLPGKMTLMLFLGALPRIPGEPRMRLFTGTYIVANDAARDPETWDYPRVPYNFVSPHRPYSVSRRPSIASDGGVLEARNRPSDTGSVHSLHTVTRPVHVSPPLLQTSRITSRRLLRPRYLCVIDRSLDKGYHVLSADDDPNLYTVPYIFISYTRKQFFTQIAMDPGLTDAEIRTRRDLAVEDTKALTQLALRAANEAGVPSFWIDFECVQPETPGDPQATRSMEDVYRICDIVRASYSIAIVVGPGLDINLAHEVIDNTVHTQQARLRQWGQRLWTLPEALLCPSNHGVHIYYVGNPEVRVEKVEKRDLAARLRDDAVGHLIDHYEGSIRLSQIELTAIALQCLQRRHTVARMNADVIYALMGLMRERVQVRPTDSAFQAFALLSQANDSQRPLERLFCMRPTTQSAAWHELSDLWGAELWDIEPECQIAEVTDSDAVILGNMSGSPIIWDPPAVDFELAAAGTRDAWKWRLDRILVATSYRALLVLFINALVQLMAMAVLPVSRTGVSMTRLSLNIQINVPLVLFVPIWTIYLLLPLMFYNLYRGTIHRVQARFYGFRGVADLQAVDQMLFGRCCNRFRWSDLNPREGLINDDSHDDPDEINHQSYTLVDTWSMIAYAFHASKPPTVMTVAGKQGGYLRVLLLSCDIPSQTFCRETVMRMETKILQRLSRMDPCKIALGPLPGYQDE